jgi:hypothetical protein
VVVPRELCRSILKAIERLRLPAAASGWGKVKASRIKTKESTERVSSDPEEKGRWEHEKASEHPPCHRKMVWGWKNDL